MNDQYRVESDLLGEIEVPLEALYGAQTQRAVLNFPVGNQRTIGSFPAFITGLLHIKHAAALANLEAGHLTKDIAKAICAAVETVEKGDPKAYFPIHALHGGGGTSANMNANEVLANIGEELLGGKRGDYRLIHPNDHVNLNQSTNDVIPAACHMGVILKWREVRKSVEDLIASVDACAIQHRNQRRIARTCLQDAVLISFADLFGGYSAFLKRSLNRIDGSVEKLHAVPIGGTIVGRLDDVSPGYFERVIPALRKVTGNEAYRRSDNLFDAAQNMDDMIDVSGQLDLFARGMIKICKDLRLMNSGPETGFCEISLPAVQPGSSIMPGKINPVMPEFVIQLSFKICGNDEACRMALDHGELDLNVWESIVTFSLLESMELAESAAAALSTRCFSGLVVHRDRNDRNVGTIIPLLTELMKQHGYSAVSDVCKQAGGDSVRLRSLLSERFGSCCDQHVDS